MHRLHPTAVLVVTGADGRLRDLRLPQVPTVTMSPPDGLVGLAGLSGPPTAVDAADAVTAVAGLDRDHPTLLGPATSDAATPGSAPSPQANGGLPDTRPAPPPATACC